MTPKKMKAAHRANGGDLPNSQSGRADGSETNATYRDIQAQHLSVIFGLEPDTALLVAELAFGEGGAR